MLFEHRDHAPRVALRQRNLGFRPFVRRIDEIVERDAPQRRLDLGHQEEQPVVHAAAIFGRRGDQPAAGEALAIFVGEIELDRRRFADHRVAVDEHGQLGGGIEREKRGRQLLARAEIDRGNFVWQVQLVEQPHCAQGARRGSAVKPDHLSLLQPFRRRRRGEGGHPRMVDGPRAVPAPRSSALFVSPRKCRLPKVSPWGGGGRHASTIGTKPP